MNPLRSAVGEAKRRYLHSVSDYYFISFPKSGRTWTKSVLANYYALVNEVPVFHDFAPIRRPSSRRSIPRTIFSHGQHLDSDEVEQRFIKTLGSKKVVLLVRDPAEVAHTFYYRLLKRQEQGELAASGIESFVSSDSHGVPQIVRFLNRWATQGSSFADFHMFSYEQCVANPHIEFSRLLEFLGETVDRDQLERALDRSLDTTRKIESVTSAEVARDREVGPAIYLGRESAHSLERYEGSASSVTDVVSPETQSLLASQKELLHPTVDRLLHTQPTPTEGRTS